jgi:tRNA/tmRNA/rRNA uracil-C5-methylase (TrmA/RlmC/RlmD family)
MINCPHFQKCSGCLYETIKKPPALFTYARRFFEKTCGIDLGLKQGAATGWRTRAKLAVRNVNGKPVIGLFEKNSHDVLSIPKCQVHHPAINEAVSHIVKNLNLTAYDEATHSGDLRYIQCVVERRTNLVQLVFVINCPPDSTHWHAFAKELFQKHPFHSIWLNFNSEKTNKIFGTEWHKVIGRDIVWEELKEQQFGFGPAHFSQSNLEMYEELLYDIYDGLPNKIKALELYAGIGIIGLSIAQRCSLLRISEIEPQSKPFFDIAYERLPIALQNRITYEILPAEESGELFNGIDTCIVDPPRKGLGKALLDQIVTTKSMKRLVYVSCDFYSLERDLTHLFEAHPDWVIQDAISYLFFPGTDQIETVVFIEKSG